MKDNIYPGKFIVIEGLNGCGKTTQVELLKNFFIKKGMPAIATKEPTIDSKAGRKARDILRKKCQATPGTLQKLFCEDRKANLKNSVIPALKNKKAVISDRYFFSTFAFGGVDLSMEWLIKMNDRFLMPDLSFFLKTRPDVCLKRITARGTNKKIFEQQKRMEKVWQNYVLLAKRFKNIYIINGEQPIKKISADIINIINKKIMNIATIIDHTNIEPKATGQEIKRTCAEAKKYGFRSVCVNPKWVKTAKKELSDSDIKIVVLIDPPMGLSSATERMKVCRKAKNDGASELDIVMNIVDLKYERYGKIAQDLKQLCKILPTKVIIGSGFLTDDEVVKASQLVKAAGAICVKTATFKDPLDHRELEEKVRHLKLMKKAAPGLLIKAAGKIKTLTDVKMMVKAGADIIGTSSGIKIIKEIKK